MDRGPWLQTWSGRAFYLLDPRPEDVVLEDVAHALSRLCRFTGHCAAHYSVAQHSVLVSVVAGRTPVPPEVVDGVNAVSAVDVEGKFRHDAAVLGLLHDAAEAYVGDASYPLKLAMRLLVDHRGSTPSAYDALEVRVQTVIGARFGVLAGMTPGWGRELEAVVHRADRVALATEARDLFSPPPRAWQTTADVEPLVERLDPLCAGAAAVQFLARAVVLGLV